MLGRRFLVLASFCFHLVFAAHIQYVVPPNILIKAFQLIYYSDATLNPSGVRFGSAEIYNVGKFTKLSF